MYSVIKILQILLLNVYEYRPIQEFLQLKTKILPRRKEIFMYNIVYTSVSQPPGRGPVPGPGINYTGLQEVLLEFVTLVF